MGYQFLVKRAHPLVQIIFMMFLPLSAFFSRLSLSISL